MKMKALNLRRFGADRSQTHIDPTPPEFNFSVFFEEVFGTKIYACFRG